MLHKKSEKGQAIIMIVFAIIGLVALTGLTVDGGRAYADRRHAQGAADSAAWAAGLANARAEDIVAAAFDIADQNGYTNDGTRSVVEVAVAPLPIAPALLPDGSANPCPEGASPNVEITVHITSHINTFFAPVIGVQQVTNKVQAVTRACGTYKPAIFGGQAIVSCGSGLNAQNPCGFDSGSSSASDWTITGSGIHSDTCVSTKDSTSVSLEAGQCLESVTGALGDTSKACSTAGIAECTSNYLDSIMPPDPCGIGGEGLAQNKAVSTTIKGKTTIIFGDGVTPKVYCITNANALNSNDIVLKNATLYFTQSQFSLKFAGGGGFSGTPSSTGTYSSLAIVVAPSDVPCPGTSGSGANTAQQLEYRGNGTGVLYGTVLAPTACIDMRGNAGAGVGGADGPLTINSQIIGNAVTSNGDASITVNYVTDQNYRPPEDPTIELVK